VLGTRQDLVACFAWKQVRVGFLSLPQNWRRRDGKWCMWHHHGGHVEIKLKTDGSMRWTASDPAPCFAVFLVLGPRGMLVI
jgi:hypothetical protein